MMMEPEEEEIVDVLILVRAPDVTETHSYNKKKKTYTFKNEFNAQCYYCSEKVKLPCLTVTTVWTPDGATESKTVQSLFCDSTHLINWIRFTKHPSLVSLCLRAVVKKCKSDGQPVQSLESLIPLELYEILLETEKETHDNYSAIRSYHSENK